MCWDKGRDAELPMSTGSQQKCCVPGGRAPLPPFPVALGAHGSDGTSLIPAPGLTSDSSMATWAVERDGHVARSSLMRASPRTSGETGCLSVGYTEQAEGKPGDNEASSSRKSAPMSSGHPDPASTGVQLCVYAFLLMHTGNGFVTSNQNRTTVDPSPTGPNAAVQRPSQSPRPWALIQPQDFPVP